MKTLLVLSLLLVCTPAFAAPPNVLNFSGHLAGSAGALSGEVSLTLALYDDPDSFAAAHLLWSEVSTVFVSEGRFHVLLGADPSNALPAAVLDASTVYVGVRVGTDDELRPRLRVASVPFSLRAEEAERLGGLAAEAFAPSGHTHAFDALQGLVAASQLPASVVLDDELTAALAAKADAGHAHDAAYVNVDEPNAVTGGMVQDGSLLLGDLGASGCTDGQVAKWSEGAGAWVCATDDDTQLTAGTGVVLEGGALRLDQATVVGWATAACFDTTAELAEALDLRYATAEHLHDDRYPLIGEVDAGLAGKSDAAHLHDARYPLATDVTAALAGKSDTSHLHDARYYTRAEDDQRREADAASLQAALAGKSDVAHLHDARYPLATDVTAALAGKSDSGHLHDAAYVNEGQAAAVTTAMLANGAVTLPKLADVGCAHDQLVKWNDAAGQWACADDRDSLFDGGDFALSSQACPFGQLVAGIGASGQVTCVDDVVYGAGTGLVLVGGSLNVDRGTIEGWAQGTCYDTPAELAAALDARYAALGHTHAIYATYADMNGALSTKADLFHEHADLYYLKDESDQQYVNEGQADAISGAMIADGTLTLADLGASTCDNGEIAKRVLGADGVTWQWGCAPDNDTQYTPGTGLALTGGRFDVVQATVEGWSRGVAYDTVAELKAAVPGWDQDASNDLTTTTSFQGQVTGLYTALTLANDVVTSANLVNGTIVTADLAAGAVTSAILQNGTIAPADLADSSVTSAAIANATIAPADLADAAVTSAAIANGTITPADLADAAVTSAAIANGTIVTADLADAIIGSAQITNGSIAAVDLANGSVTSVAVLDGSLLTADYGAGSVTSAVIQNATIAPADLADASVTSAAIANGTVGTVDLAVGSVHSAIVQNFSLQGDDLADGAVGTNALANDGVTASKLAASSVTTDAILDATITAADLASGAVTSAILANGTITSTDLATNSVLTSNIADATILAADLAAASVTSAAIANATVATVDLADGAVTTAILANATVGTVDLADGAVTSAILANGTVATADLAPDCVTTAIIANGSVGAVDLAANSVTTAAIANLAVGTLQLAANAVTAAKIQDGTIATADLAADAITSALITNGTIAGVDLGNGIVTNAHIAASATIDPAKILGTAWTGGNDGTGSGLDADLLDGQQATAFAASSHNHDTVYWKSNTASLRLATTAAAPTCDAATVGEVRLSTKYNLCICGAYAGPAYAWRLPDGTTACAW